MTATIRSYSSHAPQWQRFQTQLMAPSHQVAAIAAKHQQPAVHPYQRQYATVYHQRYTQLAPLCWQAFAAAEKQQEQEQQQQGGNGDTVRHVSRILELSEGIVSVVVGTLVKEAVPDATDEPLVKGSECRASDELFLEDDSGRVALECGTLKHQWPTGSVVAVQGTVGIDGTMRVERIYAPGSVTTALSNTPMRTDSTNNTDPCYLLCLSGLDCGNPAVPPTARELLLAFLQGRLNHPAAPRVSRVLVAGGWAMGTKPALQDADGWLDNLLATGIPCDILPSQADPTTANWPQRPLHRSLLPRSSRWATCHRTPNPYQATYGTDRHRDGDGVVVVATDGLNVRAQQSVTALPTHPDSQDIAEGWEQPTPLQVMRQHLEGCHLCPTGPSLVPTMPHAEQDPMVLPSQPRVYVTGGHEAFATRLAPNGTRLVAVPSFGATGIAVLIDLNTLNVQLLKFVDETE